MEVANRCGYEIGHHRWKQADEEDVVLRKRGRKSMKDNPDFVAAVKKCLSDHSQACSQPCKNSEGEWVPTWCLTKPWLDVYHQSEDLWQLMGERTMKRIMSQHLREFKRPRRLSDYCQICHEMDEQVLPEQRSWMTCLGKPVKKKRSDA